MVGPIPYWQFVGELVNAVLLLGLALWFFFVRPWKIRGKLSRGDLNKLESAAKIKNAQLLGLLWLVLALCDLTITLHQADFFGDSVIPTALVIAMAIVVFAVLLPAMRKVKSQEST